MQSGDLSAALPLLEHSRAILLTHALEGRELNALHSVAPELATRLIRTRTEMDESLLP